MSADHAVAMRVHGARAHHPDPGVRVDAYLQMASLEPAERALGRLAQVLETDPALSVGEGHAGLRSQVEGSARALDAFGFAPVSRSEAIASASHPAIRAEARAVSVLARPSRDGAPRARPRSFEGRSP